MGDAPQAISLTPDGRFLAVAHGTENPAVEELRILEVQSDATLQQVSLQLVPDSPLDLTWLSNDILAVTETDFFDSFARTFQYDATGGQLTQVDAAVSGGFNTRLATARDNSLLFANNTLGDNSIFAYTVEAGGQLTTVDNELTFPVAAVNILASRDGNFLYGAGGISGDGHRIPAYSIDAAGALEPLAAGSFTSPGESPSILAITEDDQFLLAGHGGDGSIHSFLRDTSTGELTSTGFSFSVGGQGDLGDLMVMGDLVFATDEGSFGSNSGLRTLRVNADGSFTLSLIHI